MDFKKLFALYVTGRRRHMLFHVCSYVYSCSRSLDQAMSFCMNVSFLVIKITRLKESYNTFCFEIRVIGYYKNLPFKFQSDQ